jgi:hypothetical protein
MRLRDDWLASLGLLHGGPPIVFGECTGGPLVFREACTVDKIRSLTNSRRFWTAVGGVLIVLCNEQLGLSEEDATKVIGIMVAWILGDSLNKTGDSK